MQLSSIAGINKLPEDEKRSIYLRLVPPEIISLFKLRADLKGPKGEELFAITDPAGSNSAELALYHLPDFPDPIVYAHLADTINGQIRVLLFVMNDPNSERFNVDILPDGHPTQFGIAERNLEAERASLAAGRSPGQVRRGLHHLQDSRHAFEKFVRSLGHDRYFIEPLHYHNAIVFEHQGFGYESGRHLMQRIHTGFSPGGELGAKLNGSNPFRTPQAAESVRLRSWAVHDGIMGQPFTNVSMYRVIDKPAKENSAPGVAW